MAVFRVPVDVEDDDVAREPAAFCRHVVRTVSRQLREAEHISVQDRRTLLEASATSLSLQRARVRGVSGRIALWMLQTDVRAEAQSVIGTTLELSGEEAVATAARLLALLGSTGRQPVLVVDDSDAWLARIGGHDRTSLIAPFFGRVLRTVADELPAALVVVVHDHYRRNVGYPRASGYLSRDIAVPRLPDLHALQQVLGARLLFQEDVTLRDLLADDALDVLWDDYRAGDANLRHCLLRAHTALQLAVDEDAAVISEHHVTAAIARLA